jgi:hypothetical protein
MYYATLDLRNTRVFLAQRRRRARTGRASVLRSQPQSGTLVPSRLSEGSSHKELRSR